MDIRFDDTVRLLAANRIAFAHLPVGDGSSILVTERWGRILGPFDRAGRPFLWLNPAVWSNPEAFARSVEEGAWNVGGERFWIAPEIRLNIKDRADFWGSYELPAAMDPGSWALTAESGLGANVRGETPSAAGCVHLAMEARMPLYNPRTGELHCRVERTIVPSPNPLRNLRSFATLMEEVEYAGYLHRVRLSVLPGSDASARAEAWTLCQLVPAGEIMLPCAGEVEYEDYYEKADASCLSIGDGVARFAVTGARRYKVGVRAASHFGRAGYLKRPAAATAELLVRAFSNDPAADYVEEPDALPGCRGLSFHVYNDGGAFGGFGELECNGRSAGPGADAVRDDSFSFWLFRGPVDRVDAIARALLGTGSSVGPTTIEFLYPTGQFS